MNYFYTKKEASKLTGIGLRQLDYWAKDKIGITPSYVNDKGSNVLYNLDHIIRLLFAKHLKKQGLMDEVIKAFTVVYGYKDIVPQSIIMTLSKYGEDINKVMMDNFNPEIFKSRLIIDAENKDSVQYVFISKEEMLAFLTQITNHEGVKFEVESVPSKDRIISILKENAAKEGIDIPHAA